MGIILASSSPRRRELMALITPDYTVRTSDVDERAIRAETPALLAQKLAVAKCRAVAESCPEDVVIGCDTVVDVDGAVFGKPADRDDARRMIRVLAGRRTLRQTTPTTRPGPTACRTARPNLWRVSRAAISM